MLPCLPLFDIPPALAAAEVEKRFGRQFEIVCNFFGGANVAYVTSRNVASRARLEPSLAKRAGVAQSFLHFVRRV